MPLASVYSLISFAEPMLHINCYDEGCRVLECDTWLLLHEVIAREG